MDEFVQRCLRGRSTSLVQPLITRWAPAAVVVAVADFRVDGLLAGLAVLDGPEVDHVLGVPREGVLVVQGAWHPVLRAGMR